MTGKALDLRKDKEGKSGSVDSPVIDNILEQRQNSANELLLEALNMDGSGDEGPNPPKKKNAKLSAPLPRMQSMSLPSWT